MNVRTGEGFGLTTKEDEMTLMDRYTVECVDLYDMELAKDGMWVMYEDAQVAIDAAVAAERERWERQVRAMHEADDSYGTGFYNGLKWKQHYAELRRMCGMEKA